MKKRIIIVAVAFGITAVVGFLLFQKAPEYTDDSLGRPYAVKQESDVLHMTMDENCCILPESYQYVYRVNGGWWKRLPPSENRSGTIKGFSPGDEIEVKVIGYNELHQEVAESDTVTFFTVPQQESP